MKTNFTGRLASLSATLSLVFLAVRLGRAAEGHASAPASSASDEQPSLEAPASSGRSSAPPLRIEIDKSKVDLKRHQIELRTSRPVTRVTWKVLDDASAVLAEDDALCPDEGCGQPYVVRWTPARPDPVGKIQLYVYDAEGFYAGVAIVPWSVSIPHEEVTFASDSAQIADSEKPKLEASLRKITEVAERAHELGTVTLFIAGHTDTVGTQAHNLVLSSRRAQAIAEWFHARGLTLPIAYEGFGSSVPTVKTADQVAEPRNRRADYILSIDEPAFPTAHRPAWKRVR